MSHPLPTTVHGRPLPAALQRKTVRWLDPDWVLVEVVDWFEREHGRGNASAGDDERERRALAVACVAVRARVSSEALDRMIAGALADAGVDADGRGAASDQGFSTQPGDPNAQRDSRRGLWPALPTHVLGEPLPERFRRRVGNSDQLLIDLATWLEAHPAVGPPVHSGAGRGRDVLIRLCIDLRERLSDPALDELLASALSEAGVRTVSSDGEMFDPTRHRATGHRATADRALHGRIAETERLGYADRGRVVQLPEVIVYGSGDLA